MLGEVIAALDPRPGRTILDCTLGGGGHARALLERIVPGGRLIALDQGVQPWLVDRKDVLLQSLDLRDIQIGAIDVIAGLRETGPNDQADVARSDDGNAHSEFEGGRGRKAEKRYSR